MGRKSDKLTPGKSAAFDVSGLKHLRQGDDTWEADFRALPKPMMQTETHYLGLVVRKRGGSVLAEVRAEYTPQADDLSALLTQAMRHPLTGEAHRSGAAPRPRAARSW